MSHAAASTLEKSNPAGPDSLSGDFAGSMGPTLRDAYLERLPFCRSTVMSLVERVSSADFLQELHGPVPTSVLALLEEKWVRPYRSYLERGGKMLRPFLVCICIEAYGRDPKSMPVPVALAEMIHSASLMLDDIVDDSSLRRGGPTAHSEIGIRASGTAASAWLNSPFALLRQLPGDLTKDQVHLMMREIAWEHWVTGAGTVIDCVWPTLDNMRHLPEQYLQSVVHRSTSYTYRLPLKLGAIAGGATESQRHQFAALGQSVGVAFQLIDDILNLRPGDDLWGKTVGEDITEGKITLQVLLALERASPTDAQRLSHILRSKTRVRSELEEAIRIIDASGAFARARKIAQSHVDETHRILAGMTFLPGGTRHLLMEFVNYVVSRKR